MKESAAARRKKRGRYTWGDETPERICAKCGETYKNGKPEGVASRSLLCHECRKNYWVCKKCGVVAPVDRTLSHCYQNYCSKCRRDDWCLRKYGITSSQKDAIAEDQEGKCAICGGALDNPKLIHVDHDHDTGLIRGVLCHHCNMALGMFQDSPSLLERAAQYVRNGGTNTPLLININRTKLPVKEGA